MSIAPFRESRVPAAASSASDGALSSGGAAGAGRGSANGGAAGTSGGSTGDGAPSPFARLLHALGDETNRGEAQMRAAMRTSGSGGRDLGPSELLALQAGVYRYSETVDLASKLVDRVSSGVKTVVQGQ